MKKKTTTYLDFLPNGVILFRERRQNIFEFFNGIRPLRDEGGKDQADEIWDILYENLWVC